MEGKGVGVEEGLEFQGFLNKKKTKKVHHFYKKWICNIEGQGENPDDFA